MWHWSVCIVSTHAQQFCGQRFSSGPLHAKWRLAFTEMEKKVPLRGTEVEYLDSM